MIKTLAEAEDLVTGLYEVLRTGDREKVKAFQETHAKSWNGGDPYGAVVAEVAKACAEAMTADQEFWPALAGRATAQLDRLRSTLK
jgi:hypothetical protein